MGNALCLSGRGESKPQEQYATAARVSPIPSVRKRRRPSDADSGPPPLQALCVAAVARRADALDISVLPTELIQRVADYLVDEGEGRGAYICVLGGRREAMCLTCNRV